MGTRIIQHGRNRVPLWPFIDMRLRRETAFHFPLLDGLFGDWAGDAARRAPSVFVVKKNVVPDMVKIGFGIIRAREHGGQ